MRPSKSIGFLLIIVLCAALSALGAPPAMMTIQGKLTDDLGEPLPARSYPFTFKIFGSQAGGVELWTENQSITTDVEGLWNATLGQVNPPAETVFADSARWLEISVDLGKGPILLPRVRLSTGPYSFHVATIDEAAGGDVYGDLRLHCDLTIGQTGEAGNLFITNLSGTNTIQLEGDGGQLSSVGSLMLFETLGGTKVAEITSPASGGMLRTYDEDGTQTAAIGSATSGGHMFVTRGASGGYGAFVDGEDGNSGHFYLYKTGSVINMEIDGDDGDGGALLTLDNGNKATITLDAHQDADGGALLTLDDGTRTSISLDARDGANGGSRIRLYNDAGVFTGEWDADGGDDGASFALRDGVRNTVWMDAKGGGGGAGVLLYNSDGLVTIELGADESDAGEIWLANEVGFRSVVIQAAEAVGNGAQIALYDSDSNATIVLDAEPGTGPGRVTTQVLEITGGADLSEQFTVHPSQSGARAVPGTVVCIDQTHPGELTVSENPYCRTVAGIISGAGGVTPGMLMRQEGSAASGSLPVALTGRVYALATGPVEVGDLLTTSDIPGHAMKVSDHDRARGAVIGKAMTSLESGEGLVLVLVSLQ